MSKFTEAYKRLQEVQAPVREPGQQESRDTAALSAASVQGTAAVPLHRHVGEPATIDEDSLRIAGLLPPVNDQDLLRRQFRRIKRPLITNAFDFGVQRYDNANVVMVTSALPATGKSFVSVNLTLSVARERDIGVILVDADVLKPKCTISLGLQQRPGLIDYLQDESKDIESILVPTNIFGLRVIPAGSPAEDATELLASKRMKSMVERLSGDYSHSLVLFDTPPLLLTNEAQVLAQHMGQILLVVHEGVSSQSSVLNAIELLDRSKPLNVVLNQARLQTLGSSYGPYYAYGAEQGRSRYGER